MNSSGRWLALCAALKRSLGAFARPPRWTRALVATCVLLSAAIVWGFRYPPGIDLPGHAHLFDVLANYHHPVHGVSGFYDLHPMTPYLLTYVLGAALAKLGGGLWATKCILFGTALLTPYALLRWLRAIDGEKGFAYAGFALAFGYPFVWGFISFGASLPLAFLCFEAWSRAPTGQAMRRFALLALYLVLLFFTHAMTFALVAICTGLLTLIRIRSGFLRRASALLVAFCVSMIWYLGRGTGQPFNPHEPPGPDRFALLFGAEFHVFAAYWTAALGLGVVTVLALVARPRLATKTERWLPLALSTLAFFTLPNFLMNTAYVGHRFVYFIHAFAPAAFVPTAQGRAAPWVGRTSGLLTVAFLGLCLLRVAGFNGELEGVAELSERVPLGQNVRSGVGKPARRSEWFGGEQLVGAHGWITATRHGMLHNDPAHYFQLPILQAKDVPFPTHLRYVLAREPGARSYLKFKHLKTELVARSGRWSLHEDRAAPPVELPVGTVLRYGQDHGQLRIDRSVSKRALIVAGKRYKRGLGTSVRSLIQLAPKATGLLEGACGIDDGGDDQGPVVCTVLDHTERVLHRAVARPGRAAVRFSVAVRQGENIYLRATRPRAVNKPRAEEAAAVDWVELAIRR